MEGCLFAYWITKDPLSKQLEKGGDDWSTAKMMFIQNCVQIPAVFK